MSIESNLEKLSNINGVTGREEDVRKVLFDLIKPYVSSTVINNNKPKKEKEDNNSLGFDSIFLNKYKYYKCF